MNEEDEKKDSEEELKEELERYHRQNQEAFDKTDENYLRDRKIREGEGTRDYRKRIYPDYKKKNKQKLPSDADIQTEGNLRGEPTYDETFRKKTPEEIAEAEKGAKEARRIIEQGKKDRGEDYDPKFLESISFETGMNLALDQSTNWLLAAPFPGARPLYALANIGGSGIINYISQRIRGTEFSLGELATASGLSLVPGVTNVKSVKGIQKAVSRGAVIGGAQVTSESLIDTGEFPDAGTFTAGTVMGGGLGGIFQHTANSADDINRFLGNIRNRLNGGSKQLISPDGIPIDASEFEPTPMFQIKGRKPKDTPERTAAKEAAGQGNIFKAFAADPRLGQTDDQIMETYKNYRIQKGDPYVEPKKEFKRGLVTRKIKPTDLEPILKEHPEIPKDKVNEYIEFVNQESKAKGNNLGKTITFLNDAYINGKLGVKKLGNLTVEDLTPNKVRTGDPQEIAEDMSSILGQNITVKTLDNIIQEKVSIPVEIADKVVMQVTDLKSLTKAYMARINRFTGIPAFERGHVFAAKNVFDDPNITSLSDFKGNLEPEISRSIYNIVDGQSFDDLLKGVDLEDIQFGNRSRADKSDPDKVVARLLGTDYGLRESFLNFVYPQRALANKIPADAKAAFIDDYVEEMNIALMDYDDGGTVGVHTLDFIRAGVLKKILPKYEALNDELVEGLITTTNLVTGRDMAAEVNEALTRNLVNPQEIRRKGEAK